VDGGCGVVAEALQAKAARGDAEPAAEGLKFELLGSRALDARVGLEVSTRMEASAERRGHFCRVRAIAACDGWVCSGSEDGSSRVWRMMGKETDTSVRVWAIGADAPRTCKRTLLGHTGCVSSLVQWQGKVLSGSVDMMSIRVWDVGTGAHDARATLASDNSIYRLAVHGDRLYCVSSDGTIRMWALGRAVLWTGGDRTSEEVY
jgi:hypothetical protein